MPRIGSPFLGNASGGRPPCGRKKPDQKQRESFRERGHGNGSLEVAQDCHLLEDDHVECSAENDRPIGPDGHGADPHVMLRAAVVEAGEPAFRTEAGIGATVWRQASQEER